MPQNLPRTPEAWTLHTGVRMHLLSLGVKPSEINQLEELVQRAIKAKDSPINRLGPQRPMFRILMRHTARKWYRKGASAKVFGCVPFSGRHGQVQPYTAIYLLPLYDHHWSRSQDPWTLLWQVKAVDLDTNPY
jgi:hypothetical protein